MSFLKETIDAAAERFRCEVRTVIDEFYDKLRSLAISSACFIGAIVLLIIGVLAMIGALFAAVLPHVGIVWAAMISAAAAFLAAIILAGIRLWVSK